jgi:hypothetical protein
MIHISTSKASVVVIGYLWFALRRTPGEHGGLSVDARDFMVVIATCHRKPRIVHYWELVHDDLVTPYL